MSAKFPRKGYYKKPVLQATGSGEEEEQRPVPESPVPTEVRELEVSEEEETPVPQTGLKIGVPEHIDRYPSSLILAEKKKELKQQEIVGKALEEFRRKYRRILTKDQLGAIPTKGSYQEVNGYPLIFEDTQPSYPLKEWVRKYGPVVYRQILNYSTENPDEDLRIAEALTYLWNIVKTGLFGRDKKGRSNPGYRLLHTRAFQYRSPAAIYHLLQLYQVHWLEYTYKYCACWDRLTKEDVAKLVSDLDEIVAGQRSCFSMFEYCRKTIKGAKMAQFFEPLIQDYHQQSLLQWSQIRKIQDQAVMDRYPAPEKDENGKEIPPEYVPPEPYRTPKKPQAYSMKRENELMKLIYDKLKRQHRTYLESLHPVGNMTEIDVELMREDLESIGIPAQKEMFRPTSTSRKDIPPGTIVISSDDEEPAEEEEEPVEDDSDDVFDWSDE